MLMLTLLLLMRRHADAILTLSHDATRRRRADAITPPLRLPLSLR